MNFTKTIMTTASAALISGAAFAGKQLARTSHDVVAKAICR